MSSKDTKSKTFIVREWKEDDCEEIMKMIRELAAYEKLEDQVQINTDGLRTDGFGPRAFFSCYVAEDLLPSEGTTERRPLIGYALYFYKYSTFEGRCIYLEDIYVQERHRGRGIGKELFRALAQQACREGSVRIDFSVLAWNKSSIGFYESIGAVNLTTAEEWNFFRLDQAGIKKLAES